jgi:subtilisin family serine protease
MKSNVPRGNKMKKLLFVWLAALMFLSVSFQGFNIAYAWTSEPEIWVLKGRPQPEEVIPWGIERIRAPDAWPTSTGVGIQVAVLDTGVQKDHVDLYANIVWGISVLGDKESTLYRDWKDKNGHGTHVTGIIAAMNNDIGVVGVGYDIGIYAIKVIYDRGWGYWEDAADGIWWAIKGPDGVIDSDGDGSVAGDPDDDAAEVISMSFGGMAEPSPESGMYEAVTAAYSYGIVLVAAAGNEGEEGVTYPAKYDEVIAVGAIDENDNVWEKSSRGPEVELAAPGVHVLSTYLNNWYAYGTGTSMACPHVSGTVGLMISKIFAEGRNYTVEGIRDILRTTADDIGPAGWDEASGYGVVRADKAVAAA